jgi:hypothetical protein
VGRALPGVADIDGRERGRRGSNKKSSGKKEIRKKETRIKDKPSVRRVYYFGLF